MTETRTTSRVLSSPLSTITTTQKNKGFTPNPSPIQKRKAN
jgi:hypothetical protein